jgi:hypothetical protein
VFNEWLPSRQGWAGRHDKLPDDVCALDLEENGARRKRLIRPNKNVIEEAREFALWVEGSPYLLACHGTGHTFAREWLTYMLRFEHPRTGHIMAPFARSYRLTTMAKANGLGRWFGLRHQDLGWVSKADYDAAKEFHATFTQISQQRALPAA